MGDLLGSIRSIDSAGASALWHLKGQEISLHKELLVQPDSDHEFVFLVKKGFLKILRSMPDGKEVIVEILGPGEFFGRLAPSKNGNGSVHEAAESVEHAIVCAFARSVFEEILQNSEELQRQVYAHIEERAERVQERLIDLAFHSAESRLARFLIRHTMRYGQESDGQWSLRSKLSQQEIGYLTGLSRQSVATQMNVWRKAEIIDFDRSNIVVKDTPSLQKIAEEA